MTLVFYGHLFSSYTQKALIALYEYNLPFEFRQVSPDNPDNTAAWLARWPLAKFPVLIDGERTVAESSIIIEHLGLTHPGNASLLPADAHAALEIRFMDRFFDLHVMDAMQIAVESALGRIPLAPEKGLEIAAGRLARAYDWLEARLPGKTWATGEAFTMADCGAGPFLFYAHWAQPFTETHPILGAYLQRLMARPSVRRAVDDARPYRDYFPLKGNGPPV